MRLIVVTRNLPPLVGGMERLNQHLLEALAPRFDTVVVGPRGCASNLPARVHSIECRGTGALEFLPTALWHTVRLAMERPRPDAVLALSGLTAPLAWLGARIGGCRQITIVHGLDLIAASVFYQALFVPAIRASALVVANSDATAVAAKAKGVPPERLRVVNPGIAWPPELPPAGAFRSHHGLEGRKIILSVGRLAARKGIAEFVERCLPGIVDAEPSATFVVVGDDARDAIRGEGSTRERILAAAARARVRDHVRLLGRLADGDVVRAYRDADIFVFPLVPVAGDMEGFGMVAAEAAACGLRTIAFREGGVADAVIPGVTGTLVERGDYAAFAREVLAALAGGTSAARADCRQAAARFSWARYSDEIVAALESALPHDAAPR